jgi:hypothetical protein
MIDSVEKLIESGVILTEDHKFIKGCAENNNLEGVVIIPDSIKGFAVLGSTCFRNCTKITHIQLPSMFYSIPEKAFSGCTSLVSINIPDSVKLIFDEAFENCNSLQKICIPKSVTNVGNQYGHNSPFKGLNIYIKVDEDNANYLSDRGSLYDKTKSVIYKFYSDKVVDDLKIEETVNEIHHYAFSGCTLLKKVEIPKSVKKIGDGAFSGCSNLSEIVIGAAINEIPYDAFENCTSLVQIEIPENIKRICRNAFGGCTSLTHINIKGNVSIDRNAFKNCKSIKIVVFEKVDKKHIESYKNFLFTLFNDAESIESITINDIKIDALDVFRKHEMQLKVMSMFYNGLGMNITKIRGNSDDKNSFKAMDNSWPFKIEDFYDTPQSKDFIFSENWFRNTGIGLVLGWNNYRAIDVDLVGCNSLYHTVGPGFDEVIDDFLQLLGLPEDYPWVIKSGSHSGFHIVFRCEKLDSEFASKAYTPNDQFRYLSYDCEKLFDRLELRWREHLVLPPSIHMSGNSYIFYQRTPKNERPKDWFDNRDWKKKDESSQNLPSTEPAWLTIKDIDNLVFHYCGNIEITEYKFNSCSFKLSELS